MEIPVTQLPPGDPRLVDIIVGQLKSKGIFDQLRKECLADVDTKPAFLNLRQRVDGQVKKFLGTKTWKNDLNKNHLRDGVRKNIQESGILDAGIDAIINQVVTPKIKTLILPYVENTVYAFLQIEKPKREIKEYDVQPQIYMEPPPPTFAYGNPVSLPYSPYGNHPSSIPMERESKLSEEIFHKLPEKIEPVVSSESDISVGGKSPLELETQTQPIADVLPMETDAISSEEDDILSRKSPINNAVIHTEADVKMDEDNAVDSFDTARGTTDDVASRVEKMNIKEDQSESVDTKDPEISKTSTGLLFDHRSLDSISSNSSGLSFSPPISKKQSLLSGNDSQDSTKFSKKRSGDELRSTQSTPLIDEKSPLNESINSSDNSKAWAPYTLPKDLSSGERVTIASFSTNDPNTVIGGISPVSTDNSHDSIGIRSVGKETSITRTEESHDSKIKSDKSEGEVSSSNSSLSSPVPHKESSQNKEKESHSSRRERAKHRSHSRDRDKHKSKDSKRHSRSHSKSKHDDHSSHRDKNKHYRRDKDDDKDRDKHSSAKGHHHRTSVSASGAGKSGSSVNDSSKEKKENSSNHHKSHSTLHSKHSSKSSSSRKESKHDSRHSHRGGSSSRKSEKKDVKTDSKSKLDPEKSLEKPQSSEVAQGKDKSTDDSKSKRILKEDKSFLMQLDKSSKKSTLHKPVINKENVKNDNVEIIVGKNNLQKDNSIMEEKNNAEKPKEKEPVIKMKITLNKGTKTGEIKAIKDDKNKLNKTLNDKSNLTSIVQKSTSDIRKESIYDSNKNKIIKTGGNMNKKFNSGKAKSSSGHFNKSNVLESDSSSCDSYPKKAITKKKVIIEDDDSSSCDSIHYSKKSENKVAKNVNKKNTDKNDLDSTISNISKKKQMSKYERRSSVGKSSSSSNSSSSDSESPNSKKVKVSEVSPKSPDLVEADTCSSDESIIHTSNVVLKKITIPVFSFSNNDNKLDMQNKVNQRNPKKVCLPKRKKLKKSDREADPLFKSSSDESEFEGFAYLTSPKSNKKAKKRKVKKSLPVQKNEPIMASDSSDMDISILQFCNSKQSKLNDFEGFGAGFDVTNEQSAKADQNLKRYLTKFNNSTFCDALNDFHGAEPDEELAETTVFAASNKYISSENNEIGDSVLFPYIKNTIPLIAIEENSSGESFDSDNDSGQSSMDTAKDTSNLSTKKFYYSSLNSSSNLITRNHDFNTNGVMISNSCDVKDLAIQSTSESSIDSLSTMSDNYFLPKKQIICNLGRIIDSSISESLESPKRKLSESGNANNSSLLPISKKRRILNAVRTEMEENMAKDNVIVNSYSLLTPEEDRTGSKEYEVDLSQRVNTYCPLSPASDSSAEDMKSKNQDKEIIENKL